MRWLRVVLIVLLLLVGTAAVAVAVVWAKLPQVASALATKVSGRDVTIGGLRLTPGRWVQVELRDLSVANLPGGTRPQMVTIGMVTGEVSLLPLLHGTLVARSVRVEQGDVLLEHVDGQPNWRDGPKRPESPGGGRGSFPTLLGIELQGVVTFRTSSGHALVTKLDGVKVEAAQADASTHVVGPGSYQGVPVQLDLKLGSYDQLHDVDLPFPANVRLSSGETVLQFDGTLMDPLGVDGAQGKLDLVAPTPEALEAIAGAGSSPAPPLRLAGAFAHDKQVWKLEQAKGALGAAAVEAGTLQYVEGSAPDKTPDKVDVNLRFGQVDLDRLLRAFSKGGSSAGEGEIAPDAAPNPEVTARLEATGLTYDKLNLAGAETVGCGRARGFTRGRGVVRGARWAGASGRPATGHGGWEEQHAGRYFECDRARGVAVAASGRGWRRAAERAPGSACDRRGWRRFAEDQQSVGGGDDGGRQRVGAMGGAGVDGSRRIVAVVADDGADDVFAGSGECARRAGAARAGARAVVAGHDRGTRSGRLDRRDARSGRCERGGDDRGLGAGCAGAGQRQDRRSVGGARGRGGGTDGQVGRRGLAGGAAARVCAAECVRSLARRRNRKVLTRPDRA